MLENKIAFWEQITQLFKGWRMCKGIISTLCVLLCFVVRCQPILSTYFVASIYWAVRRFTTKSREVSKPRDWMLWWSYRYEIWQASRQRGCWCACQISERLEKSRSESCVFEISRGLAVRRPSRVTSLVPINRTIAWVYLWELWWDISHKSNESLYHKQNRTK